MNASQFSDAQKAFILKQSDDGVRFRGRRGEDRYDRQEGAKQPGRLLIRDCHGFRRVAFAVSTPETRWLSNQTIIS
ncbi:hypothetical protein D3C87_1142340 [compost metagenome]